MYVKLFVAYGIVFALLVGYLVYIQRQVSRLETRIEYLREEQ